MADSDYRKKKAAARGQTVRAASGKTAKEMGSYRGQRETGITVDRFAEVLEFGLQRQYEDGNLHVTELKPGKKTAVEHSNLGICHYQVCIGQRAGDLWDTQGAARFETISIYAGGSQVRKVSEATALKVANDLGITYLGSAKTWEDIANGNHEFFGWARKRPIMIADLHNRLRQPS